MMLETLRQIYEELRLWEKLSSAKRKKLDDEDFAVPERRAWPIQSIKQAKIAIGFMKRKRGDVAEYPRIKEAIAKRYPKLKAALKEL